jgi:nucleoside-diphosphate-sugar epimerase
MKSIAVIGCGWLGLPIASDLAERGFQVTGTTTREERIPEIESHGVRSRVYRIGDPKPPQAEGYVINVPPSKSSDYVASLRATAEQLQPKSNVLFISTTSVYTGKPDIFPESQVVPGISSPSDHTTTSKHSSIPIAELIQAEGVFWSGPKGRGTILRCGGLVGPGREPGRFLAGKTDVPDPDSLVSISPLDEVVYMVALIIATGDWGKVINAVERDRPTRKEFYTKAALALGLIPPTFK